MLPILMTIRKGTRIYKEVKQTMSKNNRTEAVFLRNKETKNTIRYGAEDDSPIMGSIYLPKKSITDGAPERINVTVEW